MIFVCLFVLVFFVFKQTNIPIQNVVVAMLQTLQSLFLECEAHRMGVKGMFLSNM